MTRNAVIYTYPFAVDIVVALLLFVGRHSLASRGMGEDVVGSILLFYGLGYCASSLFMRKIVRPQLARWQMVVALLGTVVACCLLANLEQVALIQILFCLVPIAISLFFNAFQAFMLGISDESARPLGATAGHYTFSWSLGFALGPFVSGVARSYVAWTHIYYLAAVIAAGVGLLVLLFRPVKSSGGETERSTIGKVPPEGRRSLIGPAWLGLALGWIGWNAISTYWPVQATQIGFSDGTKGLVEFTFALTQALAALGLVYFGAWHHRASLLPLFGLGGCLGLVAFGVSEGATGFLIGVVCYGVYTSSIFSNMVYHSMLDVEKAVKRVSLNETFVGLSFLIGPVVAASLHQNGAPFWPAYRLLAVFLGIGIFGQMIYARLLMKTEGR
jgi:MFS family permease